MLNRVQKGDLTGYIIASSPNRAATTWAATTWDVILVVLPEKDPHPFVVWRKRPDDDVCLDGGYHDTLYEALGDYESRKAV